MNRREALLLKILAGVLVVAVAGTGAALLVQRRGDARARLARASVELGRLAARAVEPAGLAGQRAALAAEVAEKQKRFYRPQDMDTYRFGATVRGLLAGEGLTISGYRTVEHAGRTFLEFTVSGSALGLSRFLAQVSDADHLWVVPSLSIDAHDSGGRINAVLRIGYETIDALAR